MEQKITYRFEPQGDLTLPEVTEMLKRIVGDWSMDEVKYKTLSPAIKRHFTAR